MILPLEDIIYEIVSKRTSISESELIKELEKIYKDEEEMPSKKEIYKALMKLELFDKISVLSQRDNKIIMMKGNGSRSG